MPASEAWLAWPPPGGLAARLGPALTTLLAALDPDAGSGPAAAHFQWVVAQGGKAWVGLAAGEPAGYATLVPLPGLVDTAELRGGVAPRWRNRGLGTRWLREIQGACRPWRCEVRVARIEEEGARFLLDRGFGRDHQELTLRRDLARPLPPEPARPGWSVVTLPPARALSLFQELYEAAFAPHRWYQPYSRAELEEESAGGGAMYFALRGETAVGFAWARRAAGGVAAIEPLGVAPAAAGQGVGRWMVATVLRRLRRAGVRKVDISTWAENEPALRLYRRLGFTVRDGCYYLVWPPPRASGADL